MGQNGDNVGRDAAELLEFRTSVRFDLITSFNNEFHHGRDHIRNRCKGAESKRNKQMQRISRQFSTIIHNGLIYYEKMNALRSDFSEGMVMYHTGGRWSMHGRSIKKQAS